MACDDSLKGCMRSSHVHHGLTLASAAPQVASALAHLGAVNPPSSVDDAYALVGSKGAATPLAEARTACCDNPQPVCKTCDDTQATVTMYVACGERAEHAASALGEVRVRLQEHAYQAATPCTQAAAPVYPGCKLLVWERPQPFAHASGLDLGYDRRLVRSVRLRCGRHRQLAGLRGAGHGACCGRRRRGAGRAAGLGRGRA